MKPLEVPAQLRPSIGEFLRRYVKRRRRVELVRAISLALLVSMLWLLAWGVVDRFVAMSAIARLLSLVALAAILAAMLRRSVTAMLRRQLDWREAAAQLERREPGFNQTLVTIVSESFRDPARLASAQMIQRLVEQTESTIRHQDALSLVPLAPAVNAVVAALAGGAVMLGLCAWTWMGLPRLLLRQLAPFAAYAPVTTTRLTVAPGDLDIAQGQRVVITAKAEPAGATMLVRTSTDGANWNSIGMTPVPGGGFTYTIPALLRDLKYEVTAGDASAGPFDVRVRRRPLVREFRIRLEYPAYVGREPLDYSNTDGAIEAPAGTRAIITLVASEPLEGAWMLIGDQRLPLKQTQYPTLREIEFKITNDARWSVEMLSDRQVSGSGPADMLIRATPDRLPVVRLVLPQGSSLLRPRDTVRIPYQAADDYALKSIDALIAIDRGVPIRVPLQTGADTHRTEDFLSLDLSQFNVVIGQVLTVVLAATDRAGQTSISAPCQILISPEGVDPDERRRVAELKEASQIAARITADLEGAMLLPPEQKVRSAAKIASAAESASMLVRSILRAGVGSRQPQSGGVPLLSDAAQVLASRLEIISTQSSVEPPESLRARVNAARESSAEFDSLVTTLWRGLHSRIILAQQQNFAAIPDPTQPIALQLRDELASAVAELGWHITDPELNVQLRDAAEIADRMLRTNVAVDFIDAAALWARAQQPQTEFLSERLWTAAQAEAVRGDGDLVWARDLQLASRAARTIDALVAPAAQLAPPQDVRLAYVDAIRAMRAEHDAALDARTSEGPATQPQIAIQTSDSTAAIRTGAIAARRQMLGWAGEAELTADPTITAPLIDEQTGAMQANALVAQKQYDQAQALDARIFPTSSPAAQRVAAEMNRVRKIGELDVQQQSAGAGSSQQRQLGAQIGEIQRGDELPELQRDSRQKGLFAVRQMQEDLADLPQRLGRVEQALERARQAQDLSRQAARDVDTAPADMRTIAQHAATIARTQADDAFDALVQLQRSSDVEAESIVVDELKKYAPETSSAVSLIARQLTPSLARLSDRIVARDIEGASRAIGETRRATAVVQDSLREARQSLLDRNPLVAAKWFADQAAAELERTSPASTTHPTTAEAQQARTITELRRAWDDSVHRVAEARLSGITSMSSILRFYGVDPIGSGGNTTEWGRQSAWQGEGLNSAARAADPPGYQDALRIYFKVLSESESKEQAQ